MTTNKKVSPETVLGVLTTHPGTTAAELAEVLGIGQSTVAKHLAALEAVGAAGRQPGGRDGGRRLPDHWAVIPRKNEAVPMAPEPSGERLGRGALGALVRDYLAARPDEAFGPSTLGKALGRSQGAVSNSLAAMAARGEVVLVGDKPRRYRAAS
jgi:hypothetical protein